MAENAAFKLSDDEDDENAKHNNTVDFSAAVEDHWQETDDDAKPQKKISYGDLREDSVWDR